MSRAYKECKKNWVSSNILTGNISFARNCVTISLTSSQMDEMKESKRLAAEEKRKNAKPWF